MIVSSMDSGRAAMHSPFMGTLHDFSTPHRDWFSDERGEGRRMQVTWHPEHGFVVLSVWHQDECAATFRMPIEDAPRLISLLATSLGEAAGSAASTSRTSVATA